MQIETSGSWLLIGLEILLSVLLAHDPPSGVLPACSRLPTGPLRMYIQDELWGDHPGIEGDDERQARAWSRFGRVYGCGNSGFSATLRWGVCGRALESVWI